MALKETTGANGLLHLYIDAILPKAKSSIEKQFVNNLGKSNSIAAAITSQYISLPSEMWDELVQRCAVPGLNPDFYGEVLSDLKRMDGVE